MTPIVLGIIFLGIWVGLGVFLHLTGFFDGDLS